MKIRLKEEKDKVERTNQVKAELEARCQRAERERDMYRLLARRWQSRLQAVLDEQRNGLSASSTAAGTVAGAAAAALQELQQEALGILNDSSDDDSEEDEEEQEDDVSMMEQDEDEESNDHSDGLGHAAAAPAHAPGNGLQDDEAYFSCVEHAAPGQVQPIHGSNSTMDEEMSEVEEEDLGIAQVTGTNNLEIGSSSESKVRAVSIASDDL